MKPLKEAMLDMSHGKCSYCECRLEIESKDATIDHFLPKRYAQTIIMITHNRSIAQTADRVLQVSDGVLTDMGRCSE